MYEFNLVLIPKIKILINTYEQTQEVSNPNLENQKRLWTLIIYLHKIEIKNLDKTER